MDEIYMFCASAAKSEWMHTATPLVDIPGEAKDECSSEQKS